MTHLLTFPIIIHTHLALWNWSNQEKKSFPEALDYNWNTKFCYNKIRKYRTFLRAKDAARKDSLYNEFNF